MFPSGFVEFSDECSGPLLYRNQPSRESYAPTLNDFMNKYVTGEVRSNDFITMLTYLKFFNRQFDKLPSKTKSDILHSLLTSNGSLGRELLRKLKSENKNKIETFGNTAGTGTGTGNNDTSQNYSIFVITVVVISAIVIGFLIACTAT